MYQPVKGCPFYSAVSFLKRLQFYPSASKYDERKFFLRAFIWVLFLMINITDLLIHTTINMGEKKNSVDFGDITGNLGCTMTCVCFTIHHKKWAHVFESLTNHEKFGKPANYKKVTERGNVIVALAVLYAIIGIIFYTVLSQLPSTVNTCLQVNEVNNLDEVCGLFNPAWWPAKYRASSAVTRMWFIYQVTTVFVLLSPSLLFFCLPWEAASHAVARLEHLRTDYLNVFKINSDEIKYTKLRLWIEHHQEILRVSAALSAATKLTIGHMSIIAGIIIGCLGTQALREGIPKSIIFIMGVLVGCFVVCHAGQSIVDETLGVSYTAYGVSWFKCDVKIQKAVLFIIMRTQKPVRLETIPFGAFDYALYLLIVKTSYTYLTVLNQKM